MIWTATDDGLVQVTRDGGKTWSSVFNNVPGLKPNAWLATIEASHFDAGTAYVTADHHQDDDYTPYVYMTTDFGKTWKSIRGDLPVGRGGRTWSARIRRIATCSTSAPRRACGPRGTAAPLGRLRGSLPVTPVRDMQIHPRDNDLLLATHGRGLYILDDLTPLQKLGEAQANEAECSTCDRRSAGTSGAATAISVSAATRRESADGATISYYLKTQPAGEVNVEIADGRTLVRRFRRVPDEAGVNRIAWDLRYEAAAGAGGGARGGVASPGVAAAPAAPHRGGHVAGGGACAPPGGHQEMQPAGGRPKGSSGRLAGVLPGTYR